MQKVIAHRIESLGYVPPSQTVYVFTHITVGDAYIDLARVNALRGDRPEGRVGFEYIPQNALEASRGGWTLNETTISMVELDDVAAHMNALGVDYADEDTCGVRVTRGMYRDIPHGIWDLAETIINNDPRRVSGCVAD